MLLCRFLTPPVLRHFSFYDFIDLLNLFSYFHSEIISYTKTVTQNPHRSEYMLLIRFISFLLVVSVNSVNAADLFAWETYLELGSIERPLGLLINSSSLSHRHFSVGYLCLHSFMYDSAQDAFDLAINTDPTLVEAHIGKLLRLAYTFST